MATAVWLLYAADRLLDARLLDARMLDAPIPAAPLRGLEARHRFHHHHRRAFRFGILTASLLLAVLLPQLDPAAIRLYLIEGSFLIGYFLLIHASQSAHRLPKELAVGLFFAAATFIPTIARDPGLRLPLLPAALLFSALCSLNCLFIYAWEHPDLTHPEAHPATRYALRHLRLIASSLLAAAVALVLLDARSPRQIPAAIALSTALLLVLDRLRHHLPATTLRAAVDIALLTPALFLAFP